VLEHWAEDTVDSSGIESKLSEAHLQLGDVVATLIRARQVEETLSELPTRFNQAGPGDGVDLAGNRQAARKLESFNGHNGVVAVFSGWISQGSESE
jgi:hypothetical protein